MSPGELFSVQLEELHQLLLVECRDLECQLQRSEEGAKPVQLGTPIGRLSRMDAIQQQEMTRAGRLTLETKLRQVRSSLDAYGRGVYGVCRFCEEPIGYHRLKARPEAPFCLACQDRRET